ncbi:MFS transporter [Acidiferrimicrobium sp. IK]|uniref:MFS transporter n=1 Tax=Acidiferrimicrobium sp. IK TaxID=2871700 RepID=UPI0021CB715F|nr:MFS transporter [Acidiferrimicrobium sp. IK]MCU4184507.1 MFS transporter [Acidiferrimicrobium sp. IK]
MERTLGGPDRTRVVVLLGAVLALSSADAATVGASATQLRSALHISNTDIGLLVAVNSVVAAVASVPFGALADRFKRTRTLGLTIILWGVAMVWSAAAGSFDRLLLARLFLGVVTAAAGPIVASLIGDYFPSGERGKIYGYLLTGELLGAGVGFAVTGDIAALSWRAAFLVLAIPAFVLARAVLRLPEPERGGVAPLLPAFRPAPGPTGQPVSPAAAPGGDVPGGPPGSPNGPEPPAETAAQRLARERGLGPDEAMILGPRLDHLGLIAAFRYVLRIPTNVTLIVASACGYFYLSGVETFAVEFAKEQYRINQAVANALLLVLGTGAVLGVLVAGRLSDRLLHRGVLNARVLVTAIAALATVGLFVPALVTRSVTVALFYLVLAAFFLSAQNPPIDAARLDIVPSSLWGRAEGVRTGLRTGGQALAPLLFGAVSDHVFGGGRTGLELTFIVMLLPLAANGILLLRAMRTYPRDVATAAAAQEAAGHGVA